MMSTLIVVSTVFQFLLTARLSLRRRIITPTVSGAVLMLLAGTAIRSCSTHCPTALTPHPLGLAGLTLSAILAIRLFGSPKWLQWTPVIGIAVGCIVAGFLGLYDFQGVIDAPLIGIRSLTRWAST